MTIEAYNPRVTFAGDGSTTSFDLGSTFVFYDDTDLIVEVVTDSTGVSETLTLNVEYTVSGGSGGTGTVDTSGGSAPHGAPASGKTLVIRLSLSILQQDDYVNGAISDAEVIEDRMDRLTLYAQQLDEASGRALRAPPSEDSVDNLPTRAARRNKYFKFDDTVDAKPEAVAVTELADGAVVLDEDDFGSDSDTDAPSQQSTGAYIAAQILDEDDFASNSATKAPSQQSTKQYIDDNAGFTYNSLSTSADGATGQVNAGNHFDVAADTGVITRTLKTADITTAGNRWRFKLTDASNKLTIATEGSETIGVDGDATLVLGIQGQVVELLSDGTNVQIVQLSPLNQVLIVDEKADDTDAGGSSAGDNTRVLNTVKHDTGSNASLASNQVTLNAGTYRVVDISAPCRQGNHHSVKLVNATDATDIVLGTSALVDSSTANQTRAWVRPGTIFTVAASKALEVEHFIQTAVASDGLGSAGGTNGDPETFAIFAVERIQ